MDEVGGVKELIFQVLDILPQPQAVQFVMILWSVWLGRNAKLWNNIEESPQ